MGGKLSPKFLKRLFLAILILIGTFLSWLFVLWLLNGGFPVNKASGEMMPIHIIKVQPNDGESVTSLRGYCVNFDLKAGNGIGGTPEKSIHYFFDGIEVTSQINGLVTLDIPPSVGSYYYQHVLQISEGWHTAKVTYLDARGESFYYLWRFQNNQKVQPYPAP